MSKVYDIILNLTDEHSVLGLESLEETLQLAKERIQEQIFPERFRISGIRVGAETCSNLFLKISKTKVLSLCRQAKEQNLKVILVTPILLQSNFSKAVTLIEDLLKEHCMDTLVINDYGLLNVCSKRRDEGTFFDTKLCLGRLFDKRLRDPRFLHELPVEQSSLMTPAFTSMLEKEGITQMECELLEGGLSVSSAISSVSVHIPYTLISTGNICEFASVGYEKTDKFKLGNCKGKCLGVMGCAKHSALKYPLYKHGNALFKETVVDDRNRNFLEDNPVTLIYTFWH